MNYKIRTWRCTVCDYAQNEPPTAQTMAILFPGQNLPDGACPGCPDHGITMERMTDPQRMSKNTEMTDAEIDAHAFESPQMKKARKDYRDAQRKEYEHK